MKLLKFNDTIFNYFSRYTGRVAFIGPVHYTKGLFVGVITDDPSWGKNNGTALILFICFYNVLYLIGVVRGVEYFKCNGNQKGLMASISDVKKL